MTAAQDRSSPQPAQRETETVAVTKAEMQTPVMNDEDQARTLPFPLMRMLTTFSISYTLFHFFVLNYFSIDEWVYRVLHINLGAVIAFTLLVAWPGDDRQRVPLRDWLLVTAALACTGYILLEYDQLIIRTGVITTTGDFVVGVIGTLLVLEFARRTSGCVLPAIACLFVGYVFAGPWLPGFLHHGGIRTDNLFSFLYSQEAIFGITAGASSRYIILFVAFAIFLQISGAGAYFMNLACALFGWARGGPGKVSVVSGILFGTVSGSAVANVVAAGTFTIPMMRRAGYSRETAAAIEATASTGGQLTPPIMGAGAFIMAEITGTPYSEIVIAAILPCLLFYIAVFAHVDLQATAQNLRGLPRSERPDLSRLIGGLLLLLPLFVLLGLLISGYSIIAAGTWGVASTLVLLFSQRLALGSRVLVVPLGLYLGLPLLGMPINLAGLAATFGGTLWLLILGLYQKGTQSTTKAGRQTLHIAANSLSETARRSLQLIGVMACAGIVVGVLGLTGLGGRFSALILAAAGESQLVAFGLAMAVSILLGMGMPTTAAYAIAAAVVAPALQQLGVPALAAHMFVFYCAVISAITPPVAIAAFAAAAIARSQPWPTAFRAMRFGIGAFIVPFLFATHPEILMQGIPLDIVRVFTTAVLGVIALACAGEGRLFGPIAWPLRLIVAGTAALLLLGSVLTDLLGIGVLALLTGWRFLFRRQVATA